ncbi:MAG: ABC transporter ATP-binding protein [Armatimonadota bacterium]
MRNSGIHRFAFTYRLLYPLLKRYYGKFVLAALLMLVTACLQYVFPYLTIILIDEVLPSKNVSLLTSLLLSALLLYVIVNAAESASNLLFHYFREKVLLDLQMRLFEKVEYLPLESFEKIKGEEISAYLLKDVYNLRGLLAHSILIALKHTVVLLVGAFLLCSLNWLLALPVLPFLLGLFAISASVGRSIRVKTSPYHSAVGKFTTHLMTSLFKITFIKLYSIEEFIRQKLLILQNEQFRFGYKLQALRQGSGGLVRFLAAVPSLLIFWIAGKEIMSGGFSIGELIGFNLILYQVLSAAQLLAGTNLEIENGLASVQRVHLLLSQPDEREGHHLVYSPRPSRSILLSFENVGFSYNGVSRVLQSVSFLASQGEVVALVGPNGSGKSTLCKLLLRLYEGYTGEIRLNGVDIKELDKFELRSLISIVPQDVYVLHGSVMENIMIGRLGASREEVIAASTEAGIHEFIESLPDGYDTQLDDVSVPLSGGQKQLIALARAILRNARIFVLDEATSQIDARSDYLVRRTIRRRVSDGALALVIAHRLSTVVDADKIVAIDHGRVLGVGKHEELYASCQMYREFCNYQLLKPHREETAIDPSFCV